MTRVLLLFVLVYVSEWHAMWIQADTASVPTGRVLTNLMRRLKSNSNDFETLHAIARLHSMSYANGGKDWNIDVHQERGIVVRDSRMGPDLKPPEIIRPSVSRYSKQNAGLPFFGHLPPPAPSQVIAPRSESDRAKAKDHLDEAITFYQRLITVAPRERQNVPLIGFGWCLVQAGKTNEAKEALRKGIELAWAHERNGPVFGVTVTEEAINYLLPLLDRQKDEAEIASLTEIKSKASKMPRAITPLVVPLRDCGKSDLIDTTASLQFDLDGTGVQRKWQWISTNAAWIVFLPSGGEVRSGLQLFGNVTFWAFWENGYSALASLDNNGDGILSGLELNGIALWHDRNSDGRSSPDEIISLQKAGVISLDTRYERSESGVLSSPRGAIFSDGSARATYDIVLEQRR